MVKEDKSSRPSKPNYMYYKNWKKNKKQWIKKRLTFCIAWNQNMPNCYNSS